MEASEFFNEIHDKRVSHSRGELFSMLGPNQSCVDSINDLSSLPIFSDYKMLEDPKQWSQSINVKHKVGDHYVIVSFKTPELNNVGIVSQGHVQITLYNGHHKLGYLNAWLKPQSGKIKFSGMRKQDTVERGMANALLQSYLLVAQQFTSQGKVIDYSSTTSQTKLDVAYFLQFNGFIANTQSPQNKFALYKDIQGKICVYTSSTNKVKGYNAHGYRYLSIKPLPDDPQYKYLGTVFAGNGVIYRLQTDDADGSLDSVDRGLAGNLSSKE